MNHNLISSKSFVVLRSSHHIKSISRSSLQIESSLGSKGFIFEGPIEDPIGKERPNCGPKYWSIGLGSKLGQAPM
jgi:hypothetical protein